jgi:hypothetical protein
MNKSIFKDKIKIGKELLRNLVGPVPEKFYDMDHNNWIMSYYDKILKKRDAKEEKIKFVLENKIPIGIDLNSVQLKVLISLIKLLNKYNYHSNVEKGSNLFRIGINELVKAYGAENIKGNTRKRVLDNLRQMSSKEFILMYETDTQFNQDDDVYEDGQELGIKSKLIKQYINLFEYEYVKIMGRKFILINFHDIFTARIDDYYCLLPDDFTDEITRAKIVEGLKNSSISKHELYLHMFLLSQASIRRQKIISVAQKGNNNIGSAAMIRTNFAKLAFQLRILNGLEKGFWSSIRQKIREYLKRAKQIGYIKKFSEDKDNDSINIELNIDKIFVKLPKISGRGDD